jgi:hypothetical protein
MTLLAVFLASVTPADPATYEWPLAGVIIAAVLNIVAVIVAALVSGSRSSRALAQTIEADRTARVLERRLDLYGDLLTFAEQRKQHRAVAMAVIAVDGQDNLDPFDAKDVFPLAGRANALADAGVQKAWNAADEADQASVRAWNIMKWSQDDPSGTVKYHERMFAAREAANVADTALVAAVRKALHDDDGAVAQFSGDATHAQPAETEGTGYAAPMQS